MTTATDDHEREHRNPNDAPQGWPATVRGVLFDLDGVLIDSARAWYQVIRRGAERYRGPAVSYEAFLATFGQGPAADQRDFFPGCTVDQVQCFYAETFPEELGAIELMDGALELLGNLRSRDIRRAVVTNTPRALASQILEQRGLAALLDTSAAAGEAAEKPSPELVQLALQRLELTPQEVVYVGDSASDRAATRSAGVFMVGLRCPGDVTVGALTELLDYLPAS